MSYSIRPRPMRRCSSKAPRLTPPFFKRALIKTLPDFWVHAGATLCFVVLSVIVTSGVLVAQPKTQAKEADIEAREQLEIAREAYRAGNWDQAEEAFNRAYRSSPENSVLKAEAAFEWSTLLWEKGEYGEAKERVDDALARAKKLRLDQATGQLLLTLGHIEASMGHLSKATSTLQICERLAREQGDAVSEALCRLNRRLVQRMTGQKGGSDAEFHSDVAQIEKGASEKNRPLAIGVSLTKTADAFLRSGDTGRAEDLLKQARDYFQGASSKPSLARNDMKMGEVLQAQNRWDEARALLQRAEKAFKKMGTAPALVTVYGLLGKDAEQRRGHQEAWNLYQRSLKAAQRTKSPQQIGTANLALCELMAHPDSAQNLAQHNGASDALCETASRYFAKVGMPELRARAIFALAKNKQRRNDLLGARKNYIEGIQLLENNVASELRHHRSIALHRANLCQVDMGIEARNALLQCQSALNALSQLEESQRDRRSVAMTHYATAMTAQKQKKWKTASKHFLEATQHFKALPNPDWPRAAESLLRLGALEAQLKPTVDQAQKRYLEALQWVQADASEPQVKQVALNLHTQLAQWYLHHSRWAEAQSQIQILIDHSDTDALRAWAYNGLAETHLEQGHRDKAIEALKAGLPSAKRAQDASLARSMRENLDKLQQ